MGNASAKAVEVKVLDGPAPENVEKPKLKPCCACPETKRARDACIIENGEENCGPLIEEHKACMRKMGFNI
ncbi:cytochrome c oxidase copper chaperone [Bombyx mandarina]|uniref:Cytochrome c oxidase copper chaperone n=1 Tax=Bombyx mandarina TaxID=7092 RepID=A0A6J2KLJ8_BOMMA|nr:cytochrome c oxidase copper chaperone [Bombyx mandarina]